MILAGGRGRRLGGMPKSLLQRDGRTLLARALDAAGGADRRVVVGPDTLPVPDGVSLVRENPPFGGPAAALGAGLAALAPPTVLTTVPPSGRRTGRPDAPPLTADWTLVLAADLPSAADLVPPLLAAALVAAHATVRTTADTADEIDAVVATDADGRRQWLTAIYRSVPLRRVLGGELDGRSLRALLHSLQVVEVPLDVQDIDTPQDVARWNLTHGPGAPPPVGVDTVSRRPAP